ncbi:MAG: hypothetical protein ACTSWN_12205 [Promethearchaeota archaeon]
MICFYQKFGVVVNIGYLIKKEEHDVSRVDGFTGCFHLEYFNSQSDRLDVFYMAFVFSVWYGFNWLSTSIGAHRWSLL